MKFAACLALALTVSGSCALAAEQCRFIDARQEREACYQRHEVARLARQKVRDAHESERLKPLEPMSVDDAQVAKSLRSICRGC